MRRKPDSNILVMQAEADHQSPSSAGAAGGGDRLGFSGETLELGVSRGDRGSRRRGWWPAHFTQSRDDLEATFNALGLGPRLQLLEPVMHAWPRGADKRARSCQVRAAHRFSADERRRMRLRLERLGIELI